MSKRLTPEQIEIVRHCAWDVDDEERDGINAALDRLDYLERKVAAAEQLARKLATSNCLLQREREGLDDAATYGIASLEAQIEVNRKAIEDYDEVTE